MSAKLSQSFKDAPVELVDLYVRPSIAFYSLIEINNMVEDSIFEKVLKVERHPRYGEVICLWLRVDHEDYGDLVEALENVKGVVAIVPTSDIGNRIKEVERFPPDLRLVPRNPELDR